MNLLEESAMTASVTPGRALRYAGGSAHGLLHHGLGHYPQCIRAILGQSTAQKGAVILPRLSGHP